MLLKILNIVGWVIPVAILSLSTNPLVGGERIAGEYLTKERAYKIGQSVDSWVLPLNSFHTQLPKNSDDFPFCRRNSSDDDDTTVSSSSPSPSRWVLGNHHAISPSAYDKIYMMKDQYCEISCQIQLSENTASKLTELIRNRYYHNYIVDSNLRPALKLSYQSASRNQISYRRGVPVGFISSLDMETAYIYNHVNIFIQYHERHSLHLENLNNQTYNVVGFTIEPLSIGHSFQQVLSCIKNNSTTTNPQHTDISMISMNQIVKPDETIVYTYDVIWEQSDVPWSKRWDIYLSEDHLIPDQVHSFSIINDIVVCFFLLVMLTSVWIGQIRKAAKLSPVATGGNDDEEDGQQQDSSATEEQTSTLCCKLRRPLSKSLDQKWRLIHGDVFRPPSFSPILLTIGCGTGAQLLSTFITCCIMTNVGLMTQIHKGSILIGSIVFYAIIGSLVGGYTTARIYQQVVQTETIDYENKKKLATAGTAFLFPGIVFGFVLLINSWAAARKSTLAAPLFPDLLLVIVLWFGIFVPLTFLGAQIGHWSRMTAFPVETSDTPREIPCPSRLKRIVLMIGFAVVNGLLPFSTFYVEFFFINSTMWSGVYFDSYGYFAIVVLLAIATCCTIGILSNYYILCMENHRWWWTSFHNGMCTGYFVFLYCVYFLCSPEEKTDLFYKVFYLGTMALVALGVSLTFGFVNFVGCLWFNRAIYAMIAVSA